MKVIFLDNDGVICLSSNWGGRSKKWSSYRSENPESSRELKDAPVTVRFDDFDKKAISVLNDVLEDLHITGVRRMGSPDEAIRRGMVEAITVEGVAFTCSTESQLDLIPRTVVVL